MRHSRFPAVGPTALVLALLAGGVQAAVVNGALDGTNHPSVGFIFAQQTDPGTCNAELTSACSAVLVSSTVAVTSGGCAESFADGGPFTITAVWISFNPDDPFDCSTASRVDSIHLHPGYVSGAASSPNDIGVLVLTAAASATPATLPTAGSQGGYNRGDPFDVVGYAGITKGSVLDYRRRFSPAEFTSGDADFLGLHITLTGGHICVSGEGGGAFLPAGQNLSGLLINDDTGGCKNTDPLRLDTANVRDFLDDYVTLP